MTMLTAKPVGGENSIEAAAFVLGFSRVFTSSEIQKLQAVQSFFEQDFPNFQALNSVTVDVKNVQGTAGITLAVNGVLLQQMLKNGKPGWTLRFVDNNIVVSCLNYTRWEAVWATTKGFLRRATDYIGAQDNSLNMISLQIVDKFVYENPPETYDASDVFNIGSPYITKNVSTAGSLWHVNQGWFDEVQVSGERARHLNVLNITSTDVSGQFESVLDHLSQIVFGGAAQFPVDQDGKLTDGAYDKISEIFVLLHAKNKAVLQETLSAKKLKQIGL